MKLYVVRHAIAEARGAESADDARGLTDEGRRRFDMGVRGLDRSKVRLDRLLHSPLRRAVETAELLVPLLRAEGETEVVDELARSPTPELLEHLRSGEEVAVVGHEPWLGELVAWLATERRELAPVFELKKGAVAVLAGEPRPGGMTLEALLPPRTLRKLGR
jgi:phosphohistidine phosphatase